MIKSLKNMFFSLFSKNNLSNTSKKTMLLSYEPKKITNPQDEVYRRMNEFSKRVREGKIILK